MPRAKPNPNGGPKPTVLVWTQEQLLERPELIEMSERQCAVMLGVSSQTVSKAKKAIYAELVRTRFTSGMYAGEVVKIDEVQHKDKNGNVTGSTSKATIIVDPRGQEDFQVNKHDPDYKEV